MAQRQFDKRMAVIASVCGLALASAMPAQATRILSTKGVNTPSITLYGSHAGDTTIKDLTSKIKKPSTDAISSVPEPAGWMMMLLGFGLLGVMTRRGAAERDEALSNL